MEGQWEVAISDISYPSMYQKCYRGKIYVFWHKTLVQKISVCNPVCTIQVPILWKLWTRSFKRDTIKQKTLTQWKCLKQRKKLRFTAQTKDRVLLFLVRASVTFLEAILALTLEYRWAGKDLTSQCLLMTMFAYILSWYTQTWSSKILLATQSSIDAQFSL